MNKVKRHQPLVGVIMCANEVQGYPVQSVHDKYVDAVLHAGGLPLALCHGLADFSLLDEVIGLLDGLLLTGSPSNVQPHLYGETRPEPWTDVGRDRLSFALIERALKVDMPVFGICRGLQELVVALGGQLHPCLHDVPDLLEHRENPDVSKTQQYEPAHEVFIEDGGLLSRLIPGCSQFWVNSLHGQGVRALGSRLRVEARAEDGLVEAVSLPEATFVFGVQWHPEWNSQESEISSVLLNSFVQAAQAYCQQKG